MKIGRYETILLESDAEVQTHVARCLSTSDVVLLHVFADNGRRGLQEDLIGKLILLLERADTRSRRVLREVNLQNNPPFIVTERVLGGSTLLEWVDSQLERPGGQISPQDPGASFSEPGLGAPHGSLSDPALLAQKHSFQNLLRNVQAKTGQGSAAAAGDFIRSTSRRIRATLMIGKKPRSAISDDAGRQEPSEYSRVIKGGHG